MSEKRTAWEWLESMPRVLVLGLMIIAMIIPILSPLGLPIVTSKEAHDYYDNIAAVPPGGLILFDIGFGAGGYPSLGPGTIVVFKHVFTLPIKLVIMATAIEGSMMYKSIMEEAEPLAVENGKVYGTDYVFLGYVPGAETAMAGVLGDPWATCPTDYLGTPLANIPVMAEFKGPDDIDLVAYLTTAGGTSEGWVYQANSRYGKDVCGGFLSMMTTSMKPYYDAGSLVGLMDGIKGAADYEYIAGYPGAAIVSTDILSVTQSLVLVYIIVGNVAFFGRKLSKGGE